VAQRVVRGDTGAKQRGCFDVAQCLWYWHKSLDGSHHVLLISTVIANARNLQILAVAKVSAAALATSIVLPPVPSNTDSLTPFPRRNACTEFIDDASYFMSRSTWILNPRPGAFFGEQVAVADSTSLHLDANLSWAWLRNLDLDQTEIGSCLRNLRCLHCR
jgi:hypothetical protein